MLSPYHSHDALSAQPRRRVSRKPCSRRWRGPLWREGLIVVLSFLARYSGHSAAGSIAVSRFTSPGRSIRSVFPPVNGGLHCGCCSIPVPHHVVFTLLPFKRRAPLRQLVRGVDDQRLAECSRRSAAGSIAARSARYLQHVQDGCSRWSLAGSIAATCGLGQTRRTGPSFRRSSANSICGHYLGRAQGVTTGMPRRSLVGLHCGSSHRSAVISPIRVSCRSPVGSIAAAGFPPA
jgi:hypothetical protein